MQFLSDLVLVAALNLGARPGAAAENSEPSPVSLKESGVTLKTASTRFELTSAEAGLLALAGEPALEYPHCHPSGGDSQRLAGRGR